MYEKYARLLLQQWLPVSDEGGATAAACLPLASVLVVVATWFTNLNVTFIFSVLCTFIFSTCSRGFLARIHLATNTIIGEFFI